MNGRTLINGLMEMTMIITQENSQALFDLFDDRLKHQAKVISQQLEIPVTKSYEVIAILWGFQSWYQMNGFLSIMKEIYEAICHFHSETITESETTLLLHRLKGVSEVAYRNLRATNTRDLMEGTYKSIKVNPEPGKHIEQTDSKPGWYIVMNEDFNALMKLIAVRTGFLKGRQIMSPELVDDSLSMIDNLLLFSGDTSQYNIQNDNLIRNELAEKIIVNMFGISFDKPEDRTFRSGFHKIQENYGTKLDAEVLSPVFEGFNKIAITVADLIPFAKQLHSKSLGSCCEVQPSVGVCLAHLPNDAMLNVIWTESPFIDPRTRTKNFTGWLSVTSISVKNKSQLKALLACVQPQFIKPFKNDIHSDKTLPEQIKLFSHVELSEYQDGYSVDFPDYDLE